MTTLNIPPGPPPIIGDRSQEEGGPETLEPLGVGGGANNLQPVAPPPEPPADGGVLPFNDDSDPFNEAFDTSMGRVDIAAGGPFAEVLRLAAPKVAHAIHSSDPQAVAAQAAKLVEMGHTGPLPKYAVNINTDNLTDPNQFNGIVHNIAEALGGSDPSGAVQTARRGKRSHQQEIDDGIAAFQRDEGFVLGRLPGQAANAAQITATRLVMATLRDKTTELARQVVAGQASPEVLLGFRSSLSQMAAFQLQLHGMAAEAGRALNAFRIQTQPGLLDLVRGADGTASAIPPSGAGAAVPPPPATPAAPVAGSPTAPPAGAPTGPTTGPTAGPTIGPTGGTAAPLGAAPAPAPAAQPAAPATAPQAMPPGVQQANAGASAAQTQNVIQLLNSQGGQQGLVQLAQQFLQLPTPAAQNAMARASTTRGIADMLGEVFYGFVLSGPSTHVVNMTGNTITLANATQERAVAAMWGKLFGFANMKEGVAMGESAALVQGYWGALNDAWRLANFALRHGEGVGANTNYRMPLTTKQIWKMTNQQAMAVAPNTNQAGLSKASGSREPAITGENVLNLVPNKANSISQHTLGRNVMNPVVIGQGGMLGRMTDFVSAMVDVAGGTVRLPMRALGASDQFFKTIAYRGEARARAYREAINAGMTGQNLTNYVDNAVNFMLPADDAAAEAFARNVTMSENIISQFPRGLQTIGSSKFGHLFAPFVKVGTNILDYGTQRVAFPVRPVWWSELTSQDPVLRDMAIAKATTGALVWISAFAAASTLLDADEDAPIVVTGAQPRDKYAAEIWRQRGMKEYSIRLGGKTGTWMKYNRLDPGGQMLGIAADSVLIMAKMDEEDAAEFGAALMAGIGNNLVNKTYMSSIAESMEVFTSYDEEQYLKWIKGRAASYVVPNIVNQYVSAQDPYLRRTVTIAEEVAKRGSLTARLDLPLARDMAGYPIKQEYLFGTRYSGIEVYDGKVDPVADEMQRLQMHFSSPDKNMRGIELDEAQLDKYKMLAGHGLKMPRGEKYIGPAIITGEGRRQKADVVELDLEGLGMWDALGRLMKEPLYKAATDGADPPGRKVQMILAIRDKYRAAAQHRLMGMYPDLIEKSLEFDTKTTLAKGLPENVVQTTVAAKRTTLRMAVDKAKDYEVTE